MKKEIRNIYLASIIMLIIFIIGVSGYSIIEKYTFIEAIFMTIITMSTVGYEEVHRLSEAGMIFTAGLIIVSLGLFAYLVSSITKLFIDGEYRKYLQTYYLKKKISKLKNHVIVCGFGRNGSQAVKDLLEHHENVVIIERKIEILDGQSNEFFFKNKHVSYIQGDASHEETLEKANFNNAKALITTLPNDAENLLIVITVRSENKAIKIISRASDDHSYSKLIRAGADNVIMPDIVGGSRMAKLVAEPDIVEFLEMIMLREGVDVNLVEISCSGLASCFVNSAISELNIRKKTGANIIGLKLGNGKYIFNPGSEYKLNNEDKLFVLGKPSQIIKLEKLLAEGKYFEKPE